MSFLQIKSVGKTFTGSNGKAFVALDDVNLEVKEGEFVSIIGHSGCGKSTVLNLIAGLLPVSKGTITVGGKVVEGPGPDRMVAFQNHSLLPWLTLRQNVFLAVDQVHRSLSKSEKHELVEHYLKMVKLTPAADRLPDQVSGGMKQRCGIARALCVNPKVLLLDEPFGALDALTRANLQDQLIKIWEKERITVVMITHDVDEALLLSDHIVMMSNGPAAQVAEIMTVGIPRPRHRLEAVDHPNYYKQRGELIYFLNKCKKAKSEPKGERPSGQSKRTVRVGYVPLVDCVPFFIAEREGLFEKYGIEVSLSREPSWRAVSDGIREGRLDAAQMVAGMPFALTLGVGGAAPLPMCTALMLSRGGNAITMGQDLIDAGVTDRESLADYLQGLSKKPVLGMVHPASMHNLMLRAWLADGTIDPTKDLELIVIPPPQMMANLQRKTIAGYCAGDPWNSRAVQEGLGRLIASDGDIWPDHPEKVLGTTSAWANQNPEAHLALVQALMEACRLADDPEVRAGLPELVAQPNFIGGKPEYFEPSLLGPYDYGGGKTRDIPFFVRFSNNRCQPQEMHWILAQMARWGLMPYPADPDALMDQVIRGDVTEQAAEANGVELAEVSSQPIVFGSEPPFFAETARSYLRALPIKGELTFLKVEPETENIVEEPIDAAS